METSARQKYIFIIGGSVAVILIAVIAYAAKHMSMEIDGGPHEDTSWKINNVRSFVDKGFSDVRFSDLNESLRQSSIALDPTCSKVRTIKNVKKKKDGYSAKLEMCGVGYAIDLEGDDESFSYKISRGGKELLSYDAGAVERVYPKKERIDAMLPHVIRMEDGKTVTLKHYSEDYVISVNSCGDKAIKEAAEQKVREWITSVGYNQEEFKFSIPNLCDGE